jgi:hypothetical protein
LVPVSGRNYELCKMRGSPTVSDEMYEEATKHLPRTSGP